MDRRGDLDEQRRRRLYEETYYGPPIEWGALEARVGKLFTRKPMVTLIEDR